MFIFSSGLGINPGGGRESPAAMSLRSTETNLRHTESSLPDRHTVHEPPPYRTRGSAIQNEFFKTLVYVLKNKIFRFFFQRSGKIVLLKIKII